ncbi:MAG: AraC family transcriptional regulator [Spirochaetales bacterium]|nr:AraC family transcriptional regulator [Spirochaetales bacterium]
MKKQDGFNNQVLIVIPPELYISSDIISKQLFITDIGCFPNAKEHLVTRISGCSSNILIICNGGRGWFESGENYFEIKGGEAIIISKNTPHRYGSIDASPWGIFWIHFQGILAPEISCRISGSAINIPFPLTIGDESRHLFTLICDSLQEGISPSGYNLACGRMWHLAGSLSADRLSGTGISYGTITECISIMENRISRSLSLGELSSKVRVTPQYLCRLFKQKTGHSPIEHYTQMKVQRACTLLDMTSDRIGEISRQIGIDDPYYFTRTFKRVMGISPRDYRKREK